MKIRKSIRKGIEAVVMESKSLSVALTPALGAKIVSIRHKPTGFELMYQGRQKKWRTAAWGDVYTDYDLCGWDEMMPTITECFYPDGLWKGRLLPDHGELWALPWEVAPGRNSLHCAVHGHSLPYRFERQMSFPSDTVLRLRYRITNLASTPFYFLWAAHPLCNCNSQTRILLPDGVREVVNARPNCSTLGDFCERHRWPVTSGGDDLSRIAPASARTCKKWFVRGKMPATKDGRTWCGLEYPDRKIRVRWSYPVRQVPYYGLWVTEGGYGGHYHVAPEPCTSMIDRMDSAIYTETASILGARASYEWTLDVSVESLGANS